MSDVCSCGHASHVGLYCWSDPCTHYEPDEQDKRRSITGNPSIEEIAREQYLEHTSRHRPPRNDRLWEWYTLGFRLGARWGSGTSAKLAFAMSRDEGKPEQ